jgi:hypothetical protein
MRARNAEHLEILVYYLLMEIKLLPPQAVAHLSVKAKKARKELSIWLHRQEILQPIFSIQKLVTITE